MFSLRQTSWFTRVPHHLHLSKQSTQWPAGYLTGLGTHSKCCPPYPQQEVVQLCDHRSINMDCKSGIKQNCGMSRSTDEAFTEMFFFPLCIFAISFYSITLFYAIWTCPNSVCWQWYCSVQIIHNTGQHLFFKEIFNCIIIGRTLKMQYDENVINSIILVILLGFFKNQIF